MLGVPASPGMLGWSLLALGIVVSVAFAVMRRRRLARLPPPVAAAWLCVVSTCAFLPFIAHRFQQDLRVTTGLHGYDRAAAGPVQSYLPGYLVDDARGLMPVDSTFATAVSHKVPWEAARAAFGSLAMETLFPRVSVAVPARADYVLTWGIRPATLVKVSRTWLVRPGGGVYPAVYLGKVAA
jgi:hypothetical protein